MIRLEEVHKRYGQQKVLDGVSFEIMAGSVSTIMGRSGAGKSVLLRHLIGLEQPDSGKIFIDNNDIVGMGARELNKIRRRLGVLFQDGALFDSLSVKDNVAFPLREHLRLSEKQVADIVHEKLAVVGMSGHEAKYPAALSGGMRKRVGLARALALDPELVFFDEPTSGLDPITKGVIYRLIKDTHARSSITYVLVSHDIQGVLDVSDEVMLLFDGRIAAKGTPEEIRNSADPAVRQFLTGSPEGPMAIE
ncbi:MAG: ABC transporter ATP-binding protein [Desulfomonile tiedjei]|nr:ABC transporter ATP-binding protein [Desulfomonile tiedjei]